MEVDKSNQWDQSKRGAIEELSKLIEYEQQRGLLEQVIAVTGDKQFTAIEMRDAIEKEDEYGRQFIQMYQMRQRISGILNDSKQSPNTTESSKGTDESKNLPSKDVMKMSSTDPKLLVISPTDDPPGSTYVTSFSYPASVQVRRAAQSSSRLSWSITARDGGDAARNKVETALREGNISFVLHYGHGDHDKLLGQNGLSVIDTNNDNLLSGKALSTISCWSACVLGLGPDAISKGARAYLGYSLPFWEPPPDQPKLIAIFTSIANTPNVALLNGETFLDAFTEGIANSLFIELPQLLAMENAAILAGDLAQSGVIFWAICFLLWDMVGFTRLGDPYTHAY